MRVLILGSGGREHAVAWKIAQSSQLEELFIAPGNAGTKLVGTNVALSLSDFAGIAKFALENKIAIIFVGPEEPLVHGIHNYFSSREDLKSVAIIGPKKEAAQLEGSKTFAKAFMQRHNIPTANYKTFSKDQITEAKQYIDKIAGPYVLKADGLAAGKGVIIEPSREKAKKELAAMLLEGKYGAASETVVIESFLDGIELSVFIITDGNSYKLLPTAKDYKRIGEGDTGLNTGGMGAISPVPFANAEFLDKVQNRIIIPTVKGLQSEGLDYKGFLFIGLMNVKGEPFVVEYNVRLGDPEAEVIIPRLKSDLLDLFEGVVSGTLSERDVEIDPRTVAAIMLVSGGYPEEYNKGKLLSGLEEVDGSMVFHAGTTTNKEEGVLTDGGRVLAVSSYGSNIARALEKSYENIAKIDFEKMNFRRDIGFDLVEIPEKATKA